MQVDRITTPDATCMIFVFVWCPTRLPAHCHREVQHDPKRSTAIIASDLPSVTQPSYLGKSRMCAYVRMHVLHAKACEFKRCACELHITCSMPRNMHVQTYENMLAIKIYKKHMLHKYTHNMALTCTTCNDSCKSCPQAPALASSHFAQLLCLPTHRALSHGTSSAPWVASSEQRMSEPSLQVKANINARSCKDQCTALPCHGPPANINNPLWFVPWQVCLHG